MLVCWTAVAATGVSAAGTAHCGHKGWSRVSHHPPPARCPAGGGLAALRSPRTCRGLCYSFDFNQVFHSTVQYGSLTRCTLCPPSPRAPSQP